MPVSRTPSSVVPAKDDTVALVCTGMALFVRLVFLQIHLLWGSKWKVPRFAYVPVELALLLFALSRERSRLHEFFVSFEKMGRVIAWGFLLGILVCGIEWSIETGFGARSEPLHWATIATYPLALLNALLSAAIYEELLFRSLSMGYMVRWLKRPLVANVSQTTLFALAHLRYFDGNHWGNAASVFVGGLIYGWITLMFKSIIPSTVGHAMINSYGMIFRRTASAWGRVYQSWGFGR